MTTPEENTYVIESDYFRAAHVNDVELSRSQRGLTRKVLRAELIDNPKDANCTVRACLVHQRRRTESDEWLDIPGPSLANTTAKDVAKFPLDSSETWKLMGHLADLYDISADGIHQGRIVVQLHNQDEVIRTDAGRAGIVRKLLTANHGGEIWELLVQLQPALADKLAAALRHQQRAAAIEKFEQAIDKTHLEDKWKAFLRQNHWMFGGSNIAIIDESRLDIKNTADIPFEVDGGFMDIVELKRPDLDFWATTSAGATFLYRKKYPIPDPELQGAIAQTAGYILQAEKHVSDTDFFATHHVRPLKPRGLVVHGRSVAWGDAEWTAFRLLNDSLHGIQVMTFDHLLAQARRAIAY